MSFSDLKQRPIIETVHVSRFSAYNIPARGESPANIGGSLLTQSYVPADITDTESSAGLQSLKLPLQGKEQYELCLDLIHQVQELEKKHSDILIYPIPFEIERYTLATSDNKPKYKLTRVKNLFVAPLSSVEQLHDLFKKLNDAEQKQFLQKIGQTANNPPPKQ